MEIEMLKQVLVSGFGGLPLEVGRRIYPRTINEGRELINRGYAKLVEPKILGKAPDIVIADDPAETDGERTADVTTEATKPLPKPTPRSAGK